MHDGWVEPTQRHCLAYRRRALDGGGIMYESCRLPHNHPGPHRALSLALPSVSGWTPTIPAAVK